MGPEPSDPRLTFGRFLADVSARHAERRALVFDDREIRYRELLGEVRSLARGLVGAGVVKGARVALLFANRPEWIVSAFAVSLIGGVLVPVNTFASRDELDYILRHSDASLLLMQSRLLKRDFLQELRDAHPQLAEGRPGRLRIPALPQLRRVVAADREAPQGAVESWQGLLELGEDVPEPLLDELCDEVEPSDDGILIYTSGSTARPKGVLHSQRAGVLQSWRFAEIMLLGPEDRVFTTYPFFWTAGVAMSIGPTFASGACLLLQETFEPEAALELIEGERATTVHAWPHQHKALGEHPSAPRRDLSSVCKVDVNTPIARLAGIEKDEYGTGAAYGLSETFTISSMLPCNAPVELRRSTSGRPLPGLRLTIVDPETGEPRPTGQEGEIAVAGVTLMRGYYKVLPEYTFDESGRFRTQDGGHLDAEGYLHWSGRLGNLIKTGGANVSPVEIEEAMARCEGVKVAIPVGVGHPTLGELLLLCVVPLEGAEPEEGQIRAFLRQRLAAYKVPKRVLFFRADELSYTGNQKIQVAPLREAALRRLEAEGAEIEGHRYGG